MKIHEYQGKEILRAFGVAVPRGKPALSVDEAVQVARELGGSVWVVKAQIHAGGRGKGGGVKIAKSIDQVRDYASQILGMQLMTHQTGPHGQKVRRLLIEEGAEKTPELIHKIIIDPIQGLTDADADALATKIGVPQASLPAARQILHGLYTAFWEKDADLAEINPLILNSDGQLIALDAKFNFDSN